MQIKSVALSEVKAGPEDGLSDGEFIVYPSTFTREPDSYGDVVAKGAFLDSIERWKSGEDVMPGMYLHDPNQIVAAAIDMGEDDHGWWVKGKFDEDPESQKVYRLLKGRRLSALSFGYTTQDSGQVKLADGKSANELRKLDALEFSFLPKGFAANSDTSVVAVKALADAATGAEKAGRVLSAKNAENVKKAISALDVVREDLSALLDAATNDEGKTSTGHQVKGEELSTVKGDKPEELGKVKSEEPAAEVSVNAESWETYQKAIEMEGLL